MKSPTKNHGATPYRSPHEGLHAKRNSSCLSKILFIPKKLQEREYKAYRIILGNWRKGLRVINTLNL